MFAIPRVTRRLTLQLATLAVLGATVPLAWSHSRVALASSTAQRAENTNQLVTVSGEGEVRAEPDIAVVTVGVTHTDPDAQTAMDEVSRRLAAVIAAARSLGVEGRDIQTTGLSLSPIYRQRRSGEETPEIEAFRASNSVSLTVRDLPRASRVLDAALAAGANTIGGLRFGLSDPERLRLEALAAAVRNAEARAQTMAAAAGVTLTGVVSIQEESISVPPRPAADFARAAPAVAAPEVPVEPGEMVIRVRVRVSYSL